MTINKEEIIAWRRHFHMYPELSGEEKETAGYIAEQLRSFGLTVKERVGDGYGLMATLPGDSLHKCAAIRADMDALPVQEANDCEYKSIYPGRMHACGHDGHIAMGLGAAKMLVENPPPGTVKFFFEPHEERKPGGAKGMIAAGVLEDPQVDGIFATHVNNSFPVGAIAVKTGTMMAASDDFDLLISGKSGHAAIPHQAIDPVAIAAQIITAYHQIISRRIDPQDCAVLTVSSINTIETYNVIPQDVAIKGTVRTFDLSLRDKIRAEMQRIAEGFCQAWGASCKFVYDIAYPPVNNDSHMVGLIKEAVEAIGSARVSSVFKSPMGGEDFAMFGKHVPAALFFTGTGSKRCNQPWHDFAFDIEEDGLFLGAQVLAQAATNLTKEKKE